MRRTKKATLIAAALMLGLMACSAALADMNLIWGYVYFDTAKTKVARCSEVRLWAHDADCGNDLDATDLTTVDSTGYYSFTVPSNDYYSVRAKWGFTICAQCDTTGTECDQVVDSPCYDVTVTTQNIHQDLVLDIDCECEGD